MSKKEQLKQIIEDIPENELDKLFKFISENFEVVTSEEDMKAIERGRKEIENGNFREL